MPKSKSIIIDRKFFEMIIKKFEEAQALEEWHEDWEEKWNDIDNWLEKGKAVLHDEELRNYA